MSGQTLSTSDTRIEALQLQSSAQGVVIPLVYGVARIPGNMLWYGGFKAVPHTTTQGGKGGGVKTQNTTFTYQASVALGLCHGPLAEIPRIWRGKKLFEGGWLNTDIATAAESYTPPSSGAMVYTVAHAAGFLSMGAITYGVVVQAENDRYTTATLALGSQYSVVAGVITVLDNSLRGLPLDISYQWAGGTRPQTAMDKLGLSFIPGAIGQAAWSGLASYGSQSIGYSGLALVAGEAYDLGTSAQVDNHNFEVVARFAYHLGTSVPDVDISLVLQDLLANTQYGAGLPANRMDNWADWSNYSVASGLLVSPAMTTQQRAADVVATAAKLTNTGPVWTGGRLRMVPYADTAVTGNGRTFTPNTTPVYDLDDNCWAPAAGAAPLKCSAKTPADRFNHVRIEYLDRANQYNPAISEAKDQADIDTYGLRSMSVLQAHWLCTADAARQAAQLVLQRSLYVVNTYDAPLPWHYALLEPMDLVTLTDPGLALQQTPARITTITENSDGDLQIEFEDYPAGTSSAALYPSQAPAGYKPDYNAAPGNVDTPTLFEGPAELSTTGIEVYAAVRGSGAVWGGAQVWASQDGTHYKLLGTVYGGARYGTLSAAAGAGASSLAVQGLGAAQLISGSSADATALATLCYVGGASPEFLAYQTATLTGAGAYTLASLVHAAYGTPANAHALGVPFVRVDDRIVKSGPLEAARVGSTLYFKFCSFNFFGGGQQGLGDVSAYTYTITGAMAALSVPIGSKVYRQGTDPAASGFVPGGALWYDTAHQNAAYLRQVGAWVSTRDGNIAVAQAAADVAQTTANTAAGDATAALGKLSDIAADGLLTPNEKPPIILDRDVIVAEQSGIDAQATNYGVTTEKTVYDSAVTALTTYLATLTSAVAWDNTSGNTTIVRSTFLVKFEDVYAARQAVLNKIAATAKTAITTAQTAADNAQTTANTAAGDATAALGKLSDIAADGLLTPNEKPPIILDRDVIVAEQSGIDAQATNYGVTTEKTAYDSAVTALTTYLATLTSAVAWDNTSGNTTIVRSTFLAKFTDVYTTRQAVLDKVSANAKSRLGALATLSAVDTPQITVGSVTSITSDTYDFAGKNINGAGGIQNQRTVTITPIVTCPIVFELNIDAARVQGDSGYTLVWRIAVGAESPTTLCGFTSFSLDAAARRFTQTATIMAYAGVTLTLTLDADVYPGAPTPMVLYGSTFRATEYKR